MNAMRNALAEFYLKVYDSEILKMKGETHHASEDDREKIAQKTAIQATLLEGMTKYSGIEVSMLWKAIYEAHIHRKSGIIDYETIRTVISADQSWKKASGHAFEEFIKEKASFALKENDISIVLQKDLNQLIQEERLDNEVRDIKWLKIQIQGNIFDLYAIVRSNNKNLCFGCIQSKTSIRDRVTRDREPSIAAMNNYFWSTIVTLDGDFLRLPKFTAMVNGGSDEFPQNGWHAMYVFSNLYTNDRIYSTDYTFKNFKEHAIAAAHFWLQQRQWFKGDWIAK